MLARLASILLFVIASPAHAIGGGAPFSAGGYPNASLVGVEVTRDGLVTVCTGFLLNADTVVTAARCFGAFNPRPVSSVTLLRGLDLGRDRTNRIEVSPNEVVIHPEYLSSRGARREWAVIKLRQGFPGHEIVHYPTLLASTRGEHYGLYGYGFDEGGRQGVLRHLFLQIKDVDAAADSADYFVFDRARGTGLCGGDEGGPVLVAFDRVAYVVGIATPEFPEGGGGCPGRSRVSKVAPVMQWLKGYADGTAVMPDDPVVPGGGGKP